MTKALPKAWGGPPPHSCDICHKAIEDEFFDGATRMGPWANMCPSCHRMHGVGIGIGRGQQYVKDRPSGRFVAIAGTTPSASVARGTP